MKGLRILIGTTDGPTEVQRITPEDPEVRCVVCLDGKAIALPISEDYDAFVRRPTGVIEALTGHPAYRADISQPIGCGYSWQLGLLAAHVLAARGRLAGAGEAAKSAVWLTGEVDHHFNIGAVDDVGLKLMRATSVLKGLLAAGVTVTVVVPEACREEAAAALADGFQGGQAAPRLLAAAHVDDVLPLLGLPRLRRRFPGARLAMGRLRRGSRAVAAGAALAAGAVLLSAAWPDGAGTDHAARPGMTAPAEGQALAATPAGAPPGVTLIETRAPTGRSCAQVAFQRVKPVITRALSESSGQPGTERPRPVAAAGLCDLRHRIVNSGLGRLEIAVVAARHDAAGGGFRTRALVAARSLDAGGTLDLDARPPSKVAAPLVQNLAVLSLPSNWPGAASRLKRLAAALTAAGDPQSWTRILASLATETVFLTTAGEIFTPDTGPVRKIGQALP